ncbi:MAG: SDR family NAD(P)-dependent oxidoreductase [Anderseniella sp.]|nr:SDR family NAD(P)-dependent oxidoreductase [Anderseniella sp.]
MAQIDLAGQVAVVTGGAQGIGLAVARELAACGAAVSLWDIDGSLAEAAASSLDAEAMGFAADVTSAGSIGEALNATGKNLGPVSILVNSAGIAGPNAPVADYDEDDWRKVIDINLNGTFLVNKALVPGMIERGYGRICNIASIAGKEGNPNASAYSASKAGVIALTKSLGKELAGHDIAVNCVTPAAAKTRIFDQMSQEHIDYMLSKIPRNRFLKVEEAASMIAWIVSRENGFTTGAVFDLSGGRATY